MLPNTLGLVHSTEYAFPREKGGRAYGDYMGYALRSLVTSHRSCQHGCVDCDQSTLIAHV